MNNSGIGIIRISGDEAFNIIQKIFKPAKEKDMGQVKSHTVHYGNIYDGDKIVDEVLVLIMRGPHTFTREDTVEIDCHGGMYVLNKTLINTFWYFGSNIYSKGFVNETENHIKFFESHISIFV